MPQLTHDDIWRLCGDIDDWKIGAIIDCNASLQDLEEALAWTAGESDLMAKEHRQMHGVVAEIYEILTAEEEEWEPSSRSGANAA